MIVELDLVLKEGPRSLWNKHNTFIYIATCDECNTISGEATHDDAEGWMYDHDCEDADEHQPH